MKISKIAAITVLVLSSFAANNVAPSKAELEAMYDKAFREFDSNNFTEALKQLDTIDARQPDVAESQNLRGVILMRQGLYDKAEAALHEALRIDPKFWNARFNLAEIPFLKRDWPEARNRFQDLLSNNVSELQGEAAQLIQYKILLTYLMEGKENMVDSILAKFELSSETPAVHYANAAIALEQKKNNEAKDWIAAAEKNFSPQLNKLFAESLYEIGWLQKQAGQGRAALEITTPAERAAKMKAFAHSRFEQAQQAFQQRDLETARKFIDEAIAADPNQAVMLTLRGEILMEQKQFDEAEAAFKKAAKIDPKLREAQYSLAQIPFKKKEYGKARERFEALAGKTPGGDTTEAAQMIKFKVFMTYLLEGKDSRAQKLMEQFQFTGDTPALYYAQAAWEFKHNNPNKANDWIASARKIYSASLNGVFADAFYDVGWLETPAMRGSPAPATEAAAVMSAQTESSPAIEPSPIPGAAAALNKQAKEKTETLALASPAPVSSGMELGVVPAPSPGGVASATLAASPAVVAGSESNAAGTPARPSDIPAVAEPSLSPTVETAVAAASPSASVIASAGPAATKQVAGALTDRVAQKSSSPAVNAPISAASATPATALAPNHVAESSRTEGRLLPDLRSLLVGLLVLAAAILLAWVFVPDIRRRLANVQVYRAPLPATGPAIAQGRGNGSSSPQVVLKNRLVGGPRQVSLQLRASEPSLRRSVRPVGKQPVRPFGNGTPTVVSSPETSVARAFEPHPGLATPEPIEAKFELPSRPEPVFESSVGPVMEQGESSAPPMESEQAEMPPVETEEIPMPEMPITPVSETPVTEWTPPVSEPIGASNGEFADLNGEPVEAAPPAPAAPEEEFEPVAQGQPVPYQMSAAAIDDLVTDEAPAETRDEELPAEITSETPVAGLGDLRSPVAEISSIVPSVVSLEPSILQPTISEIMPEPIQIPTAPVIRTPSSGGSPQPASAMQTAVQLTFSFEIASMQLTPTFKMGALQLRPTSKVVTMRLAPSQQPQPAMNLQVTFEIAKIQPSGGGLGVVRLAPSQQQRPTLIGSPSFTVGGLQLISNFEAAPVQLTPSQQAAVFVTGSFQIATVEFSPAFEIASIVLNATSKQVAVQLAGAGSIETAPMFEIGNLQLGASGEIGMMQLNLLGQTPRRAA